MFPHSIGVPEATEARSHIPQNAIRPTVTSFRWVPSATHRNKLAHTRSMRTMDAFTFAHMFSTSLWVRTMVDHCVVRHGIHSCTLRNKQLHWILLFALGTQLTRHITHVITVIMLTDNANARTQSPNNQKQRCQL